MHAFEVLTPTLTDEQQRRYDEMLRRARLDKAKRVGSFSLKEPASFDFVEVTDTEEWKRYNHFFSVRCKLTKYDKAVPFGAAARIAHAIENGLFDVVEIWSGLDAAVVVGVKKTSTSRSYYILAGWTPEGGSFPTMELLGEHFAKGMHNWRRSLVLSVVLMVLGVGGLLLAIIYNRDLIVSTLPLGWMGLMFLAMTASGKPGCKA